MERHALAADTSQPDEHILRREVVDGNASNEDLAASQDTRAPTQEKAPRGLVRFNTNPAD